jgi:hypothetical protein
MRAPGSQRFSSETIKKRGPISGRQAGRQATDRQTDKETDRQRDRQTDRRLKRNGLNTALKAKASEKDKKCPNILKKKLKL